MDVISAPDSMWIISGRLMLATALGAVVGYDREVLQKPAGVRTLALVALGSSLVALMSALLTHPAFGEDLSAPSRIIQGLVAGVGFIGGGVILRLESEQRVEGLTTAASIWVVAAIGIAAGLGLWRTATLAVAIALVVLLLGRSRGPKSKHPGVPTAAVSRVWRSARRLTSPTEPFDTLIAMLVQEGSRG